MPGRIVSDANDRENTPYALEMSIDDLNSDNHPEIIGHIVANCVATGNEPTKQFVTGRPARFL